MTTIYLVSIGYSKVNIASVEVIKETAKSYMVDRKTEKMISGCAYVPNRIRKDSSIVFHTLEAAQAHCLHRLEVLARKAQMELVQLNDRIVDFRKEIGAGEDQQARSPEAARDLAGDAEIRVEGEAQRDRQADSGG